MTQEELKSDDYRLDGYAKDFFNGAKWKAHTALVKYGAGIAPMPPMPEVEGMTTEQVGDYFMDQYYAPAQGTNLILSQILAKLTEKVNTGAPSISA